MGATTYLMPEQPAQAVSVVGLQGWRQWPGSSALFLHKAVLLTFVFRCSESMYNSGEHG